MNTWLTAKKYDKVEAFKCLKEYKKNNKPLGDVLEAYFGLVQIVINKNFSGINDFDGEDLMAVGVEHIYSVIFNSRGIFSQDIEDLSASAVSSYIYIIAKNSMKGFLSDFPLTSHLKDIGEIQSDNISSRGVEYQNDIHELYRKIPGILIKKMCERNRFCVSKNIIEFFVLNKVIDEEVPARPLREVFNRKKPKKDIDDLTLLYNWSLYEIWDDYYFNVNEMHNYMREVDFRDIS